MASAIEAIKTARLRPLNQVTVESDERIAKTYNIQTKLLGVSAEEGICEPKTAIGKNPAAKRANMRSIRRPRALCVFGFTISN
jgi:hypothetical protein